MKGSEKVDTNNGKDIEGKMSILEKEINLLTGEKALVLNANYSIINYFMSSIIQLIFCFFKPVMF